MTAEKIIENGIAGEVEEEDFSDDENFVDEIGDEDLLGDILQQKPKEGEAIECCVIVDGIPIIGQEKLPRLRNVLDKLFEKLGKVNSSHYPLDENEQTKGYVFVEFASKTSAEQALEVFNGYRLDKSHTFKANSFADLDKFKKPDAKWTAPQKEPYKDLGNLKYWLLNRKCMDQFSMQYKGGDMVSIMWNNINDRDNSPIVTNESWTETIVKWSPQGTYLATFHAKGVALWAGEKFTQFQKYAHPNVQFLDFSPCETYLVTYAQPKSKWTESADAIRIWEVRTGALKRSFPAVGGQVQNWPYFKWSTNDTFFASMKEGAGISVYETPNVTHHLEIFRIRQKDVPVETMEVKDGIQAFAWEPTGSKFCVLQGSHLKPQPLFYRVQKDGIAHIKSLDAKQGLSTIMWAPAGGWLILGCIGTAAGGQLIFVDASGSDVSVMNDRAEHAGATSACWDPTGRYLCTSVSIWDGRSTDLGYRIWNFQGKELVRQLVEKFCQLQWRPRPPSLLPEQKTKEVKRKLKLDTSYAQQFEIEDQRDKGKASKDVLDKRQKQKREFEEWRRNKDKFIEEDRNERIKLRGGFDTEAENQGVELEEETIELPLTHEETIIETGEEE